MKTQWIQTPSASAELKLILVGIVLIKSRPICLR